ncbi:MAG: MBL fold metallo-hydrolase [Pseudomonas sp.]|jgi:glyoxylase-like metal-dependent hydrolase (beta-lactamase superfamily II)|nr:MBL fold metallo-hydrolase [Pseudomonas sp.]MDD2222897.1 MBL fold metallo-hydrolase [Pseudomonas sp.]MDY0414291.1 MBL fold metallo-hydrolase [Pseudomonas sp.]
MRPAVTTFFDPATYTYSYVVRDPASQSCVIIDSVLDYDPASGRTSTASAEKIVSFVREQQLTVDWLLETHVHADHLSAAPYLKQQLGGQLAIGTYITTVQKVFGQIFNVEQQFAADGSQFDRLLQDGDTLTFGALSVQVMHTPGHTPACLSYLIGNAVFVGDTLFMPDYGTARCDFPGGDARTLYASIQRLFQLPDNTRMFMCHDYKAPGREEYCNETTVAAERQHNIHVHQGVSVDEFVAMRSARDATLAMPTLILPSVQVNMRAGELPPAESNGVSYLKIPLNAL